MFCLEACKVLSKVLCDLAKIEVLLTQRKLTKSSKQIRGRNLMLRQLKFGYKEREDLIIDQELQIFSSEI